MTEWARLSKTIFKSKFSVDFFFHVNAIYIAANLPRGSTVHMSGELQTCPGLHGSRQIATRYSQHYNFFVFLVNHDTSFYMIHYVIFTCTRK